MDIPVQITDYIVHLNESNKKQSSIKICVHDLSSFFKWIDKNKSYFDNEKWLNLKRNDYLEYLAYLKEKKMSEANLKRISSHLNGMLRFYGLYNEIGPLRRDKSKYLMLDSKDLITDADVKTLLASILSKKGLTETQLQMHSYLRYRNLSIVMLMINYGLTLSEVHNLNIQDINFSQNTVEIHKENDKRIIELSSEDKRTLYKYFTDIPILYRPREYTNEPFFLAFSPKKLVFWYDNYSNRPKRISKIGISRVIENEVERAGITHARAIHFRNRCVLKKMELGFSNQDLMNYFGFKNRQALYRFKHYIDKQ
ncbi:tyrosine-type recombinase/integrase [Priestia aryabhattai]|uniref:Site-specific integrase n=1 Tax=Priestia aryabhattai TaxID=412384 RepID=A0ABD7X477_PRIAR|nr:site-specific integrase [Priestia aryabhattai]WEA47305.1 site-specific integrase [Priestia aryabhattai]